MNTQQSDAGTYASHPFQADWQNEHQKVREYCSQHHGFSTYCDLKLRHPNVLDHLRRQAAVDAAKELTRQPTRYEREKFYKTALARESPERLRAAIRQAKATNQLKAAENFERALAEQTGTRPTL